MDDEVPLLCPKGDTRPTLSECQRETTGQHHEASRGQIMKDLVGQIIYDDHESYKKHGHVYSGQGRDQIFIRKRSIILAKVERMKYK